MKQEVESSDKPSKALKKLFSSRELEVTIKLANGNRVSDIAAELGLSVKTVSTYLTRVKLKAGICTDAQVGVFAAKQGLV